MSFLRLGFGLAVASLLNFGCGGDESSSDDGGGGASSGRGGTGAGTGADTGGGTAGSSGSGARPSGGSGAGGLPTVPGDPDATVDTALPPVPRMVNVKATATGDSVSITYDPIDGAMDYRVYVLPPDEAISTSNGVVSVQNALYRCAGNRMTPPVTMDNQEQVQSGAAKTLVDNQDVGGYTRTLDEATLGYVFAEPAEGRTPVYALGDGAARAEQDCFFMRWHETRVKRYTTSEDERDQLIAAGFRDDGISFYAPLVPSTETRQVFTSSWVDSNNGDRLAEFYFVEGSAEVAARDAGEPAFLALAEATDGAIPLMRVYYHNVCGISHDELVAGRPRFERARRQGDDLPLYALRWSGLAGPTTLVVEALDQGCPKPANGIVGPVSKPAYTNEFGNNLPPWTTPAEMAQASPTGEAFINGQFDASNRPRAIARSFVRIEPAPDPDLDWFMGFGPGESLGTLVDAEWCGELPPGSCWQQFRQTSEAGDFIFMFVESDRWAMAPQLGELWVNYADLGADVNGKFRFTPTQKARVEADSYLYATMEVNAFTTARRYPQMLISDQDAPVQHTMASGYTLVVQTFGDWPYFYELQVCDHQVWDVNNQCPKADLRRFFEGSSTNASSFAPNAEVGEQTGVDRSTRFEVYVSSQRAYLLLDGQPYGCVDLPAGRTPTADVTVTFGDVLYHSGVDMLDYYDYVKQDLRFDSTRHYDNLGFKSGVSKPAWDESRLPCTSRLVQ